MNDELNQLIKKAREAVFFIRSIDSYENSKIANDLAELSDKVESQKLLIIGRLAYRAVYRHAKKRDSMMEFIKELFDEFYPDCGDIDGGTLQDMAEKHGILIPEIRHAPCGEFCNCAQIASDEEWQEGLKCYRLADWLNTKNTNATE